MRRCEQEFHATAWAIEECKKYGIESKITETVKNDYQEYIFDELDRGIRRGGSHYPSKDSLTLNWGDETGKALQKLNAKQINYCKTMSYAIHRAKQIKSESDLMEASGKLRGFLDCLLQMNVIDVDELKAIHLWFTAKNRA
jgi:hypothetical protein